MIKAFSIDDLKPFTRDRVQYRKVLAVHTHIQQLELETVVAGATDREIRKAEEGGGQVAAAAILSGCLGGTG